VASKQWGAWAVAFVWFTTHFGGGFASGRQLVDFYVRYGWYAIFTPFISVGIIALVLYNAWSFSVREKVYDYRSWSTAYFKPLGVLEPFFSFFIEVMFLIILLLATAVAFATGGSLLTRLFPALSYNFVTLSIAILIFALTIWGAEVWRKAATIIGIVMIAGVLVVYSANLIVNLPKLTAVVGSMPSANGGFWEAVWLSVKYAGLQCSLIGAYTAVADSLKTQADVKKAALIGFVLNAGVMTLAATGILTHYPQILTEATPITYITEHGGMGGAFGAAVVSGIILLALVSTGVGLIYGGARRISSWWVKRTGSTKTFMTDVISSAIYVILSWCIASFGLLALISQGYVWVGTFSTPLVVVPVLFVAFLHKRQGDSPRPSGSSLAEEG
jgi:uncharacterized membrane protein YkvI